MQRAKGPVAAVLLGAAGLPGFTGAALAQTPLEPPTRVEAPAQLHQSAAPAAFALSAGPLQFDDVSRLHWAAQQRDLAAQRAQFAAAAPREPVTERELLRFDQVVAGFDRLMREDARLPPALLADLGHVLEALGRARPGTLDLHLDEALRTLPSATPRAPSLPRTVTAPRGPASPQPNVIPGPGNGPLLALLTASPTTLPDQAQAVLQSYAGAMAGAHRAFAALPNLSVVMPVPLVYASGDGQMVIPPGSRLTTRNGQVTIQAPSVLYQHAGLAVVSRDATIHLGSSLDGISASSATASGRDWTAQLDGALLGVSAESGAGIVRADRATIHLREHTAHLEGAQLLIGPSGDLGLDAQRVRLVGDAFALDLGGASATQTREGTRVTADAAAYTGRGTTVQADRLDLSFGRDGAQLAASRLSLVSGSTTLEGTEATLVAKPLRDGGHALELTAERLAFADGSSRLETSGDVSARMVLDERGQLRSGTLSAEQIALDARSGRATLGGGEVNLTLDERGQLTRFSGRGEAASFTGDGFGLEVGRGALNATFGQDGRLERLGGEAGHVTFRDARGAFEAEGGRIDARFGARGLAELSARADAATWRGADGARLDARETGVGLWFDEGSGLLRKATASTGGLDVTTRGGQQASVLEGRGEVHFSSTGALARLQAEAGRFSYDGGGHHLELSGPSVSARFDDAGLPVAAEGRAARLEYRGPDGSYTSSGPIQLAAEGAGGLLTRLTVSGDALTHRGAFGELTAAHGSLEARFGEGGAPERLLLETRDVVASGGFGRLELGGGSVLDATWSEGALSSVSARADQLDYREAERQLAISGGRLDLTLEGERVREARASLETGSYSGDFGRLELGGGSALQLRFEESGAAHLDGAVTRLDLTHGGGRLGLDGGRAEGSFGADGALERLSLAAERLTYAGTAEGGHPLDLDIAAAAAVLTNRDGGGQRLDIETGAGRFEIDGHRVSLDGVHGLVLETTPDGQLDAFSARFPGQLELVQRGGDLEVATRGLGASYAREGSTLRLDFAEADVALRSQGLSARIIGGEALLDDRLLRVEVQEARFLREIGQQLDVHVEALTLDVARGAAGALEQLDLSLGALDARIGAMHIMARTPSGERVRLFVSAGEGGETIKEAFLQIPQGGEVRLTRDDLDLRLGGQLVRFTHGDDGVYRLRAEGIDVAAQTRDAQVRISGGDAQVSLDPATGRLVIDEIRGTRVDVRTADITATLDLQELRSLMVRMTRLEGGVTGAALHLIPTADDATISAELRANIGGVPVQLRIRDARELEAIGALQTNQVHVLMRDPSGRGDIHIGVGPVDLRGSAIELVGRYHPYDPARMTESVHQFVTTGGARLFSGVTFEPDGVLRLGTDREGLNGELAVILPRQHALPGYRMDLSTQPSAAPGVVGSVGYRSGDVTASVFAGLLPGAHATLHVAQGSASVGGVPIPERTDLPATAVGGLRLDLAQVAGGRLGVVGGGFVNPVGLVDSPFLEENKPYGAFGGLEYTRGNWSVSGSAVLDVDRNGRAQVGGAMLRLGVRF